MIRLQTKMKWVKFVHPLGGDWYRCGDVTVCITLDRGLWHMSVSLPTRYPTWDEIYTAWYDLCPDADNITGAILLPRKSEYVNFHPNCFHIHQLMDSEIPAGVLL